MAGTPTKPAADLAVIEAQDKKFEEIVTDRDPRYADVVEATKIVAEFIREKNLILYGGTAIDFALRLYGDFIYPEKSLKAPDLDFYSPDSVGDAYELTDRLFAAGYKETRAIRALYVRAMKVDIGDNHFIAAVPSPKL